MPLPSPPSFEGKVTSASSPSDDRKARGRIGEAFAQELLEREGYRIVDTNVRFGRKTGLIGEIDIVAWEGATLCIIEVKARRAGGAFTPSEAVTPAKQLQIARLALAYANHHRLFEGPDEIPLRFDVVTVGISGEGEAMRCRGRVLRGAFLAPDSL